MTTVRDAALAPPSDPAQPPEIATACRYTWCSGGQQEHQDCEGGWIGWTVPTFNGTTTIAEAQLADYSKNADTPVIDFDPDHGHGLSITSAQLRAIVADGRAHLDRLAQLADQYDAMVGGCPMSDTTTDERHLVDQVEHAMANGYAFEAIIATFKAIGSPDPAEAFALLLAVAANPDDRHVFELGLAAVRGEL